jgi:iron(III) transport system ATP-binding protein
MPTITVENLTKKFGEVKALDRVNLRVQKGELFFLLGPSGCGKTTLLRHIAGFYTPEEGRILFDDDDVTSVPPHKRNTGMMFQSYALWPHMTVAKNVAFGLEERRVPRAEIKTRVARALSDVRMEAYADRKIAQLSGGQQQRIALARALVIRPRCLLLDEPLSNLDAKLRLEMRSEIRRICKEFGLTAIYVTHDQKEALSISDRMAILENGRIAQVGTPEEVYHRPHTRVVADFIGETNFLEGTVSGAEDGQLRVETAHGHFRGLPGDRDWHPAPGTKVLLSMRPEAWRIAHHTHDSPAPENSLTGRVEEKTYLGEIAQYQVKVGETVLKFFELNPRPGEGCVGERVRASVGPDDVVVVPA